jgi:PhnB protein
MRPTLAAKLKLMKIPEQYLPIIPYLIITDARAFSNFAKAVFGAKEQLVVDRTETLIMHGELRIHDAVIMFADATEQFKERPAGMWIYVIGVDDIYAKAIAQGATSLMTPVKRPYGYTGGFQDAWGNQWWVVEGEQ